MAKLNGSRDVIFQNWPFEAGPIYGQVRAALKKQETPIGAMDLLIAAQTLVA